jgi:hypothetical protein
MVLLFYLHFAMLLMSDFDVNKTSSVQYCATLSALITSYYYQLKIVFLETSDVSVCVSPNGWAWLVHGRRLVVWRYSKSSASGSGHKWMGANCRELTLPPSDLAHSAKLVRSISGLTLKLDRLFNGKLFAL